MGSCHEGFVRDYSTQRGLELAEEKEVLGIWSGDYIHGVRTFALSAAAAVAYLKLSGILWVCDSAIILQSS